MTAPTIPAINADAVKVLLSAEQIADRTAEMAVEIAAVCGHDVMIVSLLRGSFVFTADLIRQLHHQGVRPQVDFITTASYGSGTESSGKVQILRDLTEDVKGRNVLIVDDILESGRTIAFAQQLITERGAKSIKVAVLLEKPGKLAVDIKCNFVGFTIPDQFVVGYGLDYANYYRELPYIGVISFS